MENDNIKGHWIGIFTQKGEQTRYISDLKRALREQS